MPILPEAQNIIINNSNFKDVTNNWTGEAGIDALRDASNSEATHDSSARAPPPRCDPGTCEKYINEIIGWVTPAPGDTCTPLYWMSGLAGVGKSAIAQTCAELIQELGVLGATFFFSAGGQDKAERFFLSIAYQLCTTYPAYREIVNRRILHDKTLVTKSIPFQFRYLIKEPLQELARDGKEIGGRIAVFVDGLDACDGGAQREIINAVTITASDDTFPLCWIFFSRPEPHIEAMFLSPAVAPLCTKGALPTLHYGREENGLNVEESPRHQSRSISQERSYPFPRHYAPSKRQPPPSRRALTADESSYRSRGWREKGNPPHPSEQREQDENQAIAHHHGSIHKLSTGSRRASMSFSALREASQTSKVVFGAKSTAGVPMFTTSVVIGEGELTYGLQSPPDTPGSEGPLSRRLSGKRPTYERRDSAGRKGGNTNTPDGNIVPRIGVLIVDNNPINRTILSTFMKRNQIRHGIASNGKEAVEKWKTGGFHVILMDIQMPVMDGIEATREIRRLERVNSLSVLPPTPPQSFSSGATPSSTPNEVHSTGTKSPYRSPVIIVALTASSLQSDRADALVAGCNDFLTKPVSLPWLSNKITEWDSIKAPQMWPDAHSEAVRKMLKDQAARARAVADRLHLPNPKWFPSGTPMREQGDAPPSSSLAAAPITGATSVVMQTLEPAGGIELTGSPGGVSTSTANILDPSADSPLPLVTPLKWTAQKLESPRPEPPQPDRIKIDPVVVHGARCTASAQSNGSALAAPNKQDVTDSYTDTTQMLADEREGCPQQIKRVNEQEARVYPNTNLPPQLPILALWWLLFWKIVPPLIRRLSRSFSS